MPHNFTNASTGVLRPSAQQGMVGPCKECEAAPKDGRKRELDVRANPEELDASSTAGLPNLEKP